MKNALLAALLFGAASILVPAPDAHAKNKCIACQNACFAKIKRCEKRHPKQSCFDTYGAEYGECKIACKGSPVCMGF